MEHHQYISSSALVATSNTLALAATVLGFDIVELWTGGGEGDCSPVCMYVHASERILQTYDDVRTGLFPSERIHILSPRLCHLAQISSSGYYWHVIEEGEEKIKCFGSQAKTEVAFILQGEDDRPDMFLVAFALDRIQRKPSKTKFMQGLGYAIVVAAYDMDAEEEEEGEGNVELDKQADIARQRLRYIAAFVRKDETPIHPLEGLRSLPPPNESTGKDLGELQFQIDENVSEFYVSLETIPLQLRFDTEYDMSYFQDVSLIGEGSNSNIFTASFNGKRVVIKMLKKEVMSNEIAILEYEAEASLLSRVSHPNIIKLLGRGSSPRKFLMLEWLSGGTLTSKLNLLQSSHGSNRPYFRKPTYTYDVLLQHMKAVAEALVYLHSRCAPGISVIHRDIKPDNVGFASDGSLKLFDFGLCTCVRRTKNISEAYEMTGNTGSLRYMAPEAALSKPYNEKVDVYSFGIMAWQMATDRVPFKGLTRAQFMQEVVNGKQRPRLDGNWPPSFRTLLESCWHDDFRKRPSFAFILDDLNSMMRILALEASSLPKLSSTPADFVI